MPLSSLKPFLCAGNEITGESEAVVQAQGYPGVEDVLYKNQEKKWLNF